MNGDRVDAASQSGLSRSAAATDRTRSTSQSLARPGRPGARRAPAPSSSATRATVVASSAIREDNPELAEARRRGLRVLHRSAALGSLMLGRRGVAVAGTHGKTTTTAMISTVLSRLRLRPLVRHRRRAHRLVDRRPPGWRRRVGRRGRRERRLLPAVPGRGRRGDQRRPRSPEQLGHARRTTPTASCGSPPATGSRLLVVSADDPGAVELTAAGSRRSIRRERSTVDHLRREPSTPTCGSSTRPSPAPARASSSGTAAAGRQCGMSVPGHYNVLERRGGVRGGHLARGRRGGGTRRAVRVRRHLPALPAGRHRRRHPGLRRLRPPPDRGAEHPDRRPDRGRGRAGSWSASSRTSTPGPGTSGASSPQRSSSPTRPS